MFKMEKKMQNSASIHKKDHAKTRSILIKTGISATIYSTAVIHSHVCQLEETQESPDSSCFGAGQ